MKNLLLTGLILFTALAELQAQSPLPAGLPTAVDVASLKVRVVVSKYQGDKRVSATPFEMSVRSDGAKAQVRMGNEVPVPFVKVGADPKQTDVPPGSLSYNYRPVGTNIDVTAASGANGRFRLDILLEDSSVVLDKSQPAPMPALAGAPIFRSFRTTNTLLLRDGESAEFTAATDRITGDTIRVSISLAVMKQGLLVSNVAVIEGAAERTNLPDNCWDAVFMRNVYHHLPLPEPMIDSAFAALKPGGRLAIIDFVARPGSVLPPGVRENRGGNGIPPAIVI